MSKKPREDWVPHKLNELGFVGRGRSRNRPRNDPSLYGGPYPFIQTADIMYNEMYITSYSQTYTEKGLAQSKLWDENTLCMTIAGANTAETAILKIKACFPDSVIGFVADPQKSNVRFVKYYFDTIKDELKSVARGTTQHNLPMEKLFAFDILTPPLPTQRKIAAVLSAYDDLIENNTRRIAILEEMAQRLYREWFVHYRYPGHQSVPLVDSPLGPVPEGWEVKRVSDVVEINPKINTDKDTEKPFVEMANLTTNSMIVEYTQTRSGGSGSKFQNNDTLFPRITPSVENGKRGFVQFLHDGEVALGSTEFIVLRSKSLCPEYVYILSIQTDFRDYAAKSMVGASGRQRVQYECFDSFFVAQPPIDKLKTFSETVAPMFQIIHTLSRKNTALRQTRDLLLPRLISGAVDVSELRIANGE